MDLEKAKENYPLLKEALENSIKSSFGQKVIEKFLTEKQKTISER
jgi:hypothetical protein